MRKKSWEIQSFKLAICCYVVQTSWYSGIGTIVLTMVLATCSYSGTTLKSVIHENVNVNPGLSFSVQCSYRLSQGFIFTLYIR